MSRKAMLSTMVAVVTGGALMFTGPAMAASRSTPAPTAAARSTNPQAALEATAQARALTAQQRRAFALAVKEGKTPGQGLTAQQRRAFALAVKEGHVAVPVPATARFTG